MVQTHRLTPTYLLTYVPTYLPTYICFEQGEQLLTGYEVYLPNCKTNLALVLHELSLLFWHFRTQQLTTWADMRLHLLLLKSSKL